MRMIKFLAGLAAILGVCIVSFNYVEGHESTARDAQIKQLEQQYAVQTEKFDSLNHEKIDIEGKLKQACGLLKAAEVENDLCEPSEEPVHVMESDEDG